MTEVEAFGLIDAYAEANGVKTAADTYTKRFKSSRKKIS
jgi:hypothetical protein